MADNVVKHSNCFLSVEFAGSADFNVRSLYPSGVVLTGIHFAPTASTDKLIVRDGVGGPIILKAEVDAKAPIYRPIASLRCKPFIDFSECTFATPASVVVTFDMSGFVG
jgi:hypothetical protein